MPIGDMLEWGASYLASAQKTHASQTVTIRRGGWTTASVSAVIGRTLFEQDDSQGLHIDYQMRDFLILVEDYVLNGSEQQPEAGDRIEETDRDGITHHYEVLPEPGVPVAEKTDDYRYRWRIHTKKVG